MGNDETKIRHETIDRTDPRASEKGRQAASDENARLVQQLEQQLQQQQARDMAAALDETRLKNLQDASELAAERQRKEELEVERERQEKHTQDQLTCEKMKGELLNYEFGNKLSIKAFETEGIDVSDMKRVLVTLFGPTGSGKTSFIGTLERTLLGAENQTAFEQGSGGEGTVILYEYLPNLNINLLDTRGFWNIDENTATECLNIMTGKTRINEVMARNEDGSQMEAGSTGDMAARSMAKFGDCVHAVIFVVQAHDKRLKEGTYLQRMKKIRDHFRFEGHSPITIITCEDKIKNDDDREIAFREASAATGSPIDRTFFITNYTYKNQEYSLDTEKKTVNILDTMLLSAERFVKIQKLRKRHHGSAESGAIKEFFKQNQGVYGWNPERVASIVQQLEKLEIMTVQSLKDNWDDVKKEVKMTIGIRTGLEQALKKI